MKTQLGLSLLMQRGCFLFVIAFVPTALAADAPQKPEMVLLPRALIEIYSQWAYDAGAPAKYVDLLRACLANNPHNGTMVRNGQDACPTVTIAIEERNQLKVKAEGIHLSQDFWR